MRPGGQCWRRARAGLSASCVQERRAATAHGRSVSGSICMLRRSRAAQVLGTQPVGEWPAGRHECWRRHEAGNPGEGGRSRRSRNPSRASHRQGHPIPDGGHAWRHAPASLQPLTTRTHRPHTTAARSGARYVSNLYPHHSVLHHVDYRRSVSTTPHNTRLTESTE